MRISVIVPAFNEEDCILACLESLAAQTHEDYEVLVVAGGNDATANIATQYAKIVTDRKNAGAAAARNQGAAKARGDILAFTDADTIVAKDWLKRIEKAMAKGAAAVGGVVKPLGGNAIDSAIFKINQDLFYRASAALGFYQLSGNNSAYDAEAFRAAGGFDETLRMMEDTELANRIAKRGRVVVDPRIVAWSSTRRFKQNGYGRVFADYVIEYARFYLLGQKPVTPYFASAQDAFS
jgi:glycosyltransferase involved in cell wall biosynthesis